MRGPVLKVLGVLSFPPLVRLRLGPLAVSPHGVFIAVGFLIGARLMLADTARRAMSDDVIYPLLSRAAVGALIGARLAYVANHPSDYYAEPLAILQVWQGGISLLGGIFGAVLAGLPRIRASQLSFWKVMDAAAPGMALGIAVGRIGDLIIGDHLGKVTSFVLGYRCPAIGIKTASPCAPTSLVSRTAGAVVHQTALYDQLLAIVLLLVLLRLRRTPRFEGFLIVVFAIGYGIARISEDFLREDLRRFGLTGSQWAAMVTVSVCGYVLARGRTPRWGRWDEQTSSLRPSPGDPDRSTSR